MGAYRIVLASALEEIGEASPAAHIIFGVDLDEVDLAWEPLDELLGDGDAKAESDSLKRLRHGEWAMKDRREAGREARRRSSSARPLKNEETPLRASL